MCGHEDGVDVCGSGDGSVACVVVVWTCLIGRGRAAVAGPFQYRSVDKMKIELVEARN